uniref:Uncharacterized protein n=1 Tax=Clastoptera arizonana TaxID=38151 RepID=A0A1B6CMJ4_9HEMI
MEDITTSAPRTASETAYLYHQYLKDLAEKKEIDKLKKELNLEGSESIGDISDLDVHVLETPVFYDDDVNVAFNIEVVKGNSKSLNVDKNVKRLYISVPNPEDSEETNNYVEKYMSKVLRVSRDRINVTSLPGNKKLVYVPQSEIKATNAIDKIVSSLAKSVLVNESHSLTKNLKKLYEDVVEIPNKYSLPIKEFHGKEFWLTTPKILKIKPDLPVIKKVYRNISKNIKLEYNRKGEIVFTIDKIKGNCNKILGQLV